MEELITQISRFPGFSGLAVEVDALREGGLGLFPQGRRLLWQRRDVAGGRVRRWREVFYLRLSVPQDRQEDWSMTVREFECWLSGREAPAWGADALLTAGSARLRESDLLGSFWQVTLTVDYTTD